MIIKSIAAGFTLMTLAAVCSVYAGSPASVQTAKPTNPSGPMAAGIEYPLDVKFDFDKADLKLTPTTEEQFKTIAQELKNYPYARMEIQGHADQTGPEEHNKVLSENRAIAVRKHFVKRYGVDESRVVVRAFGDTRPESPDMKENRRVIVRVFRMEPNTAGTDKPTL